MLLIKHKHQGGHSTVMDVVTLCKTITAIHSPHKFLKESTYYSFMWVLNMLYGCMIEEKIFGLFTYI